MKKNEKDVSSVSNEHSHASGASPFTPHSITKPLRLVHTVSSFIHRPCGIHCQLCDHVVDYVDYTLQPKYSDIA